MLQRLADGEIHLVCLGESHQRADAGVNGDLSLVSALLDGQNHVGLKPVTEDLANLCQTGFDFFAVRGSNFVLPASVFHVHENLRGEVGAVQLLVLGSWLLVLGSWFLTKSRLRAKNQQPRAYFFTLLWCVLGIFMSSRYLATVRRVTWMPCDCRMRVICSSVKGFDGSSSSMSFFTRRFKMRSDVFPPSGPFTLS